MQAEASRAQRRHRQAKSSRGEPETENQWAERGNSSANGREWEGADGEDENQPNCSQTENDEDRENEHEKECENDGKAAASEPRQSSERPEAQQSRLIDSSDC